MQNERKGRKGKERKGTNNLKESSGWGRLLLNQAEARGGGGRGKRGVKIRSVGGGGAGLNAALPCHRSTDAGGRVGGSFPLRREQGADALQMGQGLGRARADTSEGTKPPNQGGACSGVDDKSLYSFLYIN